MPNGTIKWFNPEKGFGFIKPDEDGSDVFLHISALRDAGIAEIHEDQKVSFEIETNRGKPAATNIQLLDN